MRWRTCLPGDELEGIMRTLESPAERVTETVEMVYMESTAQVVELKRVTSAGDYTGEDRLRSLETT